ncbi:MAG: YrdB family protein [Firmicutes bacterium]|nr:YrdB family protein [Bacillota bacterium]
MNLALRFLLELGALAALGYWGWTQHQGMSRWLVSVTAPLAAAVVWAVFRVPGDGGPPVVAVRGAVRLALEAGLFLLAILALVRSARPQPAAVLAALTILHYLLDHKRVLWLLRG